MESVEANGELIPVGGGDTIPLLRSSLVIGRRESCDVWLDFPNVSGRHCQLTFRDGVWIIRDLNSTNGIKVNDLKATQRMLNPGDRISIAKRVFTIQYTPSTRTRSHEDILEEVGDIIDIPLLEKAGLERPDESRSRGRRRKPSSFSVDED